MVSINWAVVAECQSSCESLDILPILTRLFPRHGVRMRGWTDERPNDSPEAHTEDRANIEYGDLGRGRGQELAARVRVFAVCCELGK